MDTKSLGKRVEKMRTRRRWELQDLATATGVSYQSLWRIERGQQGEPGAFTLAKIAKALGCSVDYLVGLYEDDPESEGTPAAVA
jgi:transcriptional regulator with XRE-family HTH domain